MCGSAQLVASDLPITRSSDHPIFLDELIELSPDRKRNLEKTNLEAYMYCNYCGKVIQEDANVCAYCGKRVGAVVARRRLVRPRVGRKVAGVAAGFAEY